jgi:hypothetical protein
MLSAGFEPTIPASERPQTYGLDRAATGTGKVQQIKCCCYLHDQIKNYEIGRAGEFVWGGDIQRAFRAVIEKREGKRPLRRLGCGWEDNIKIDAKEIKILYFLYFVDRASRYNSC